MADVQHTFTGERHWAAYVAGAYYVLAKQRKLTRRVTGANISVYSTLPLGTAWPVPPHWKSPRFLPSPPHTT